MHFYKSEAQGSNPAGYNNHFGHPSVRCPKPYRAITIILGPFVNTNRYSPTDQR